MLEGKKQPNPEKIGLACKNESNSAKKSFLKKIKTQSPAHLGVEWMYGEFFSNNSKNFEFDFFFYRHQRPDFSKNGHLKGFMINFWAGMC